MAKKQLNPLQSQIDTLVACASKDKTRYTICGIFMDHKEKLAVATNGCSMAVSKSVYEWMQLQPGFVDVNNIIYDADELKHGLVAVKEKNISYPNWKTVTIQNHCGGFLT